MKNCTSDLARLRMCAPVGRLGRSLLEMRNFNRREQALDAELDAALHEIEHLVELVGGCLQGFCDVRAGRAEHGLSRRSEPAHDRRAVDAVHLGKLLERDAAEEVQSKQVAIAARG